MASENLLAKAAFGISLSCHQLCFGKRVLKNGCVRDELKVNPHMLKSLCPFMDFLEGLNPQQREAAAHFEGPLLILAGAGSGKTRVITHRIAHLIHYHRIPPYMIRAVTFTHKAADEMRNRIEALLNQAGASGSPTVSTFHSFCVRMLRREGDRLASIRPGFTRSFTVYDDDDQLSLIKTIFRGLGLDDKFMPYRGALSRISH